MNVRFRASCVFAATAIMGAIIAPPTASAAVVYAFSNTSGDAFTFESPDYITSPTFATGAGLLSCSGRFLCAPAAGVFFPGFNLQSGPVDDFVAILEVRGVTVNAPWVFPLGAFSANGSYASANNPVVNFSLTDQVALGFGTLTVTGSPPVSVPEPTTLPLALLALAGAPLWVRRRGSK